MSAARFWDCPSTSYYRQMSCCCWVLGGASFCCLQIYHTALHLQVCICIMQGLHSALQCLCRRWVIFMQTLSKVMIRWIRGTMISFLNTAVQSEVMLPYQDCTSGYRLEVSKTVQSSYVAATWSRRGWCKFTCVSGSEKVFVARFWSVLVPSYKRWMSWICCWTFSGASSFVACIVANSIYSSALASLHMHHAMIAFCIAMPATIHANTVQGHESLSDTMSSTMHPILKAHRCIKSALQSVK